MKMTTTATTSTADSAAQSVMSVDRASRIEKATSEAVDLIRAFSERDPHDGDEQNPWNNPDAMLEELDRAHDRIVAAWKDGRGPNDGDDDDDNNNNKTTTITDGDDDGGENSDLRAAYMDMITNAFADVLEDMRSKNEEEIDVDVLVDCLQSGMDLMTMEEKELFMAGDEVDSDDGITAHEQRRIQLGLNVC